MIPRILHVWTCEKTAGLVFVELLDPTVNKYVIAMCYNGSVWKMEEA